MTASFNGNGHSLELDTASPALQVLIPGEQWVCFDENKAPISPFTLTGVTGALVEGNKHWATFEKAVSVWHANAWIKGVGREFIKDQRITGIDLDTPDAHDVVKRINSFTERSPSDNIHIFAGGSIPHAITAEPFIDCVEMYDQKRYFTITGKHYPGTPDAIEDRQEELTEFYHSVIANRERKSRWAKELRGKIEDLKTAVSGTRNDTLSKVAFRAGVLIEKYGLIEDAIKEEIWEVCEEWDNPTKTAGTLNGQIQAGKLKAREEPGATREMPHYMPKAFGSSNGNHPDSLSGAFNRTDLGNAERFAQQHRDIVRWCQVWNSWLVFNGKAWEQDTTGQVDRLAKDTIRSIYNEAAEEPDDKLRAIIAKHAVSSESNRAVRAMLDRAKSELPAMPDKFNKQLDILNCRNGTLNLVTGELRPHNPEDMQTRCLDIDYNPLGECPRWLSFIRDMFERKVDLIEFVKQGLGMSLSGDISEQCWFLCHGGGNNGKSTLIETVGDILASYALSAKIETFQTKKGDRANYDQAEFYGARLITASENQQGTRLNEAFMKKITGGEKIRAEHKYGREFEFMPECTIWLSVNHKPVIKDTSKGMWRRVRFIPFLITLEDSQIDPKLREKLMKEAEGILAWLVQGCMAWYRQGRLIVPEEVAAATQSYREEQDVTSRFLSEECSFDDKKAKISTKALNTRYEDWCEQNGEKYSAKDLKAELNRRGLHSKRSGKDGGWMYTGVSLATTTEPPPEDTKTDGTDGTDIKSDNFSRREETSEKLVNSMSVPSVPSVNEHATNENDASTETPESKSSPFEMPKASVAQMRETLRAYARSKGWPKLMVHENYAIGPTETLWEDFLSKPGFYNLEWQMAYKKVCEWNAMYPQRGKK